MLMMNIVGFALIALIVWWFWIYQPKDVAMTEGGIDILVQDGVYQPSHIKLSAHQAATLNFTRKDASPCAESVQFPELDITVTLPVNQTTAVALPSLKPGEYVFHCQMQMYKGVLKVEGAS